MFFYNQTILKQSFISKFVIPIFSFQICKLFFFIAESVWLFLCQVLCDCVEVAPSLNIGITSDGCCSQTSSQTHANIFFIRVTLNF